MQTYEINLWLDKKIIEKIVKQFDSDDKVLEYIENHYNEIEYDMNSRNSTAKKQDRNPDKKTRKRREELSLLASKSIKKEDVEIVIKFS